MTILAQLLVACLAVGSSLHEAPSTVAPADAMQQVAAESFSKLRKIHLVRPDLIAYPLVIDFIC